MELNNAKKNIEERTNGAVIVNLYPNNTFGNLVDGVEDVYKRQLLSFMVALESGHSFVVICKIR